MRISSKRQGGVPRVVIVRDRASAGGGIYAYYEAIRHHLKADCKFINVGRQQVHYSKSRFLNQLLRRTTPLRLCWEWLTLIAQLLRAPDFVHINPGLDIKTRRSLRRDAVNVWLAKLFRRKVLVFWRGWDNAACGTAEFPGGNGTWLYRIYQQADAHVVLARDFERDLRRWNFSAPIEVETTAVPDEIVAASPSCRALNDSSINLLFLSRIEIAKGVFELLEAFRVLHERNDRPYTLTFAGDGPDLGELRKRAEDLGCEGVAFPGYVTGKAKIESYQNADIFCFLSYTEGMPNAVLEALAMGLPIVSSDAGGLKDILQDEVTGFFVTQDRSAPLKSRFSPDKIADRVEQVVANCEGYRRMSIHNRQFAHDRFTGRKVAERLDNIYLKMLNSPSLEKSVVDKAVPART